MSEYDNELSKIVAELNRAAPSQKYAAARTGQSTASLDQLLHAAAARGASDVLLIAGAPAMLRVTGNLTPLAGAVLEADEVRGLVLPLLEPAQLDELQKRKSVDLSFVRDNLGRFRVNIHHQRGTLAASIRLLPSRIPSLESLHLPLSLAKLAERRQGLVLVTGPTGCGKSSTLAALIDIVNTKRAAHVVTIEDPVEYQHANRSAIIEQIEVGRDTPDFAVTLRSIMRQTPDVILVGEMRDSETIATALTAAETGHLVFSTLHTNDTIQAMSRILDSFPAGNQPQIRQQMSLAMSAVVAQQLVPGVDGVNRWPAVEVMVATDAVRALIRKGDDHQLRSQISVGRAEGMTTMELRLRTGDQGIPRQARPVQHVRAPGGTVWILERHRPGGRDGGDLLHVAGRAPRRPCAVERIGLPGHGPVAAHADARLLARCAGRFRGRPGAVARARAASPARRGSADHGRARCRGCGGLGLLHARAQLGKGVAGRTRHRRAPARRAAGGDARGTGARGAGDRVRDRPARPLAGAAPPCWRGAAGADSARNHRLRRSPRPQPTGPDGERLARVRLADQPQRQTALKHPGPPDSGGERAGALLEGGPAGLRRAPRARFGRGRVCDRTPALPHGDPQRQARARLRGADARRPRPGGAGAGAGAGAHLDGRSRARHAPVQPTLVELARTPAVQRGRAARLARSARGRSRPLHTRARGDAEHALPGGGVRHALARGLDLVRARQRVRGAAVDRKSTRL